MEQSAFLAPQQHNHIQQLHPLVAHVLPLGRQVWLLGGTALAALQTAHFGPAHLWQLAISGPPLDDLPAEMPRDRLDLYWLGTDPQPQLQQILQEQRLRAWKLAVNLQGQVLDPFAVQQEGLDRLRPTSRRPRT